MRPPTRFATSLALVVSAWAFFLLSPFLFLDLEEARRDYVEGALGAFLFWVPLAAGSVCTFLAPRRAGIAVASVVVAVPGFMVLTYGSGIGVLWLLSGLMLLAANLLRPRPPIVTASLGRASGPA